MWDPPSHVGGRNSPDVETFTTRGLIRKRTKRGVKKVWCESIGAPANSRSSSTHARSECGDFWPIDNQRLLDGSPHPFKSPSLFLSTLYSLSYSLANGETRARASEEEMETEGSVDAATPPREARLISAGASHSVALLSGDVACSWGRGEDGQLGHGDAEDRLLPTLLSALDSQGIESITCGADHTTAYSESELQLYSWGWGDFGRLGHGNSSDVFSPQPIKALQGIQIKQIACGDSHCLAVTINGEVQSWGRNQNGQLGLGTTEDSLLPQKIEAFKGISIKMVAAGAEHTAAVTEDGDLYGWGWGRYGNLGLGDRNDRLIPEKAYSDDGQKMVLVACGWRHTITVSSSGKLYTYGWSKYGQLGHGNFEDHLVPHQLEALKDSCISQISGGWRHTMAQTSDGELYGWGWNKFGQLGVGDNIDHCFPVQLKFPNDEKVVQISCGWRHTLALTERKNIFSWGRGSSGQLGHGDILDRNTPKLIEALSMDGSSCRYIKSSIVKPNSGKVWVSPSDRYAIVPDDSAAIHLAEPPGDGGGDVNVPEKVVKRIRV